MTGVAAASATLSRAALQMLEPVIDTAVRAGVSTDYARSMVVAAMDAHPALKPRQLQMLQVAIRLHAADLVIGNSIMLAGQPLRDYVRACVHSRAVAIVAQVMMALARRSGRQLDVSCSAFLAQYALPIEEGYSAAHASEWATSASLDQFVQARLDARAAAPPRASPPSMHA